MCWEGECVERVNVVYKGRLILSFTLTHAAAFMP